MISMEEITLELRLGVRCMALGLFAHTKKACQAAVRTMDVYNNATVEHPADAECWGESTAALLKLCPKAKLPGLTETNVCHPNNNRDMAAELFDDHIASEMTLGETVIRGFLSAPGYETMVWQH